MSLRKSHITWEKELQNWLSKKLKRKFQLIWVLSKKKLWEKLKIKEYKISIILVIIWKILLSTARIRDIMVVVIQVLVIQAMVEVIQDMEDMEDMDMDMVTHTVNNIAIVNLQQENLLTNSLPQAET